MPSLHPVIQSLLQAQPAVLRESHLLTGRMMEKRPPDLLSASCPAGHQCKVFLKKLNSELCLILTDLRFLALAASIALFTTPLIYPVMLAGDAGQLLQIVLFDMLCMIIYHFELIQNEPILWLEHNSHNFSASCLFGWHRHTLVHTLVHTWYTPWYTPLLWIRTCHGWGWQCSWANSYGWPDTGWGIAPHQQPAGLSGHSGWIHYTWSAQTDRQTEEWGREGESMGYTKHHGLFLRMSFILQFITHEALVEW